MQWATLYVFSRISEERYDELDAVIEESDVIYVFGHFWLVAEALRKLCEKLKGKVLILYREMVNTNFIQERVADLENFINEFESYCEAIYIHLPRHRIVYSELFRRYPVIRTGLVIPYVFTTHFPVNRKHLRFIHYQQADKWWKGSDIVDKLKHLPHIIVGYGADARYVSLAEVLHLQATSELLIHPSRIDSTSRFALSGMLLACVPVFLMTDAEMWFVLANASSLDKIAAYNALCHHFPIYWTSEELITEVEKLFQSRELIDEWRCRLLVFLTKNTDLFSPTIIYNQFAEQGLKLPSDLQPVVHWSRWKSEDLIQALPQGNWSGNPPSLVFEQR